MPHLILLGVELLYMIPCFSQYGVIRKGAYVLLAECELVLLKKKKIISVLVLRSLVQGECHSLSPKCRCLRLCLISSAVLHRFLP